MPLTSCTNQNMWALAKYFRSAYSLAKKDGPFPDHFDLLQLQDLNGADIPKGLRSHYSATAIISHVAREMRQKISQQIVKEDGKVSILIDESTTLSTRTTLIVHLNCQTKSSEEPHFLFLDLLELPSATAETITKNLLSCMSTYGFRDSYLQRNLVGFTSDDASVMLGNSLVLDKGHSLALFKSPAWVVGLRYYFWGVWCQPPSSVHGQIILSVQPVPKKSQSWKNFQEDLGRRYWKLGSFLTRVGWPVHLEPCQLYGMILKPSAIILKLVGAMGLGPNVSNQSFTVCSSEWLQNSFCTTWYSCMMSRRASIYLRGIVKARHNVGVCR